MTALGLACRLCASQPGERCRFGPLSALEYGDEPHAERVMDAAGMVPDGAMPLPDAVVDRAFEDVVDRMF